MAECIRPFQNQWPVLGNGVYIDPQASVIGKVELGDDVSVWPMAVIRGDVNDIKIGKACNIQDGSILHCTHDGPYSKGGKPLILGQGITVGHGVMLHACTIDDYCLIGMGVIVLDGAYVEHHVIIAAGSLVAPNSRLLSGHLYMGSPARMVRPLKPEEFEQLEYSSAHYVRLKDKYC